MGQPVEASDLVERLAEEPIPMQAISTAAYNGEARNPEVYLLQEEGDSQIWCRWHRETIRV